MWLKIRKQNVKTQFVQAEQNESKQQGIKMSLKTQKISKTSSKEMYKKERNIKQVDFLKMRNTFNDKEEKNLVYVEVSFLSFDLCMWHL